MENIVWEHCPQPSLLAGAQHFKPQVLPIHFSREDGVGSDGVSLNFTLIFFLMGSFISIIQVSLPVK